MQAFLSLAFGVEAFLMSSCTKHDPEDQSVHFLLALTMWACAVSIVLEIAWPYSLLPSAARSLSCIMQGMWMIQVGCHTVPQIAHGCPICASIYSSMTRGHDTVGRSNVYASICNVNDMLLCQEGICQQSGNVLYRSATVCLWDYSHGWSLMAEDRHRRHP